jgi:8-oxo-dGTP pyrophosphatase MutT (NUDIX family)
VSKKSAIIPYRFVDGKLEILLITKSFGSKWVIPKGNIEEPLKPHISATKEAFEEGGVLGRPHPIRVGAYYDGSDSGPIPTFLLEVDVELHDKDWQEEHKRERRWVDADECDKYVKDEKLLSVIKRGIRCLCSDGEYFKRAIKTYCEEYKWKLLEADQDHAEFEFSLAGGRTKPLYITRHDSTVEFSVPSFVVFKSIEEIPDALSTILLRRNAHNRIGFWCIDQIEGKFAYSCVYNAELKLLDNQYFAGIVHGLVTECNAIEQIILIMESDAIDQIIEEEPEKSEE